MTQMISIFDDAIYGDVFYNGNGDKYRYVGKSDSDGEIIHSHIIWLWMMTLNGIRK